MRWSHPCAARSRANPLGGAGGHRSSRHFLMQPGTIAMVLAAAVAHAVWNLASKYKRGDTLLFVWAYSCASTLLWVPIGLVLMVQGQGAIDWRLGVGAAVSAALHIAYSLTLQAGYDRAELGVVYPIARGTGPVLTMLFAILLLGSGSPLSRFSGHSSLSQAFLSLPATRLEAEPAARSRGFGEVLRGHHRKLYRLGQLCGHVAAFGAGELLRWHTASNPDPDAKRTAPMASHSPVIRADAVPILIVAVFSPLAYILVLTAMLTAPLALVAPVRESSIIIGSLLAYRLFREGHLARRVAGAAIVLAGIAAISV